MSRKSIKPNAAYERAAALARLMNLDSQGGASCRLAAENAQEAINALRKGDLQLAMIKLCNAGDFARSGAEAVITKRLAAR